jgi:uncharacterized RDD family membrane protein YckC
MRCPKCQYITFESGDRCRNCGYEFSLAAATPDLDLPIQTGDEPEGPLSVPDPAPPRPITQSFDLPLFTDRAPADDRPLVSAPAVPRAPLSVRKPSAALPRPAKRPSPEAPRLDLVPADEPPDEAHVSPHEAPAAAPADRVAPAGARLLAAVIDVVLLGAIGLAVLHFTLAILLLDYGAALAALPWAPFVSFLLILIFAYVTAFTAAGGQSLGKMAARIKVVPVDPGPWSDRVPLGQSALRAAGYLVSALPAGLGFLPALLARDGRALHDRLAHTQVVKT